MGRSGWQGFSGLDWGCRPGQKLCRDLGLSGEFCNADGGNGDGVNFEAGWGELRGWGWRGFSEDRLEMG